MAEMGADPRQRQRAVCSHVSCVCSDQPTRPRITIKSSHATTLWTQLGGYWAGAPKTQRSGSGSDAVGSATESKARLEPHRQRPAKRDATRANTIGDNCWSTEATSTRATRYRDGVAVCRRHAHACAWAKHTWHHMNHPPTERLPCRRRTPTTLARLCCGEKTSN